MTEQQLDRKDLKIMAYKNKVSELEEKLADVMVDFTILSEQLRLTTEEVNKYKEKYGELEEEDGEPSEDTDGVS